MRKPFKLIAALALAGAMGVGSFAFVGCDGNTNGNNNDPAIDKPDPDKPDPDHKHADANGDYICDKCGDGVWDNVKDIADVQVDDVVTTPVAKTEAIPAANTQEEPLQYDAEGKIVLHLSFYADSLENKKYTDGWTDGTFELAKNTTVRGRNRAGIYNDAGQKIDDASYESSVQLGDNDSALILNAVGAGTLTLHVQNGSSGTTGTQSLTMSGAASKTIKYPADGGSSQIQEVKVDITKAGKYTIKRASGTSDIFYADFETHVEDTAVESIKIANPGKTQYLVGEAFDWSELIINAVHEANNRPEKLQPDDIEVNYSNFDSTQAGTYSIGVKYVVDSTELNASYDVEVYSYEDLQLGFNMIKTGEKNYAGNGMYVNHAVQRVYVMGEDFDDDGLTATVIGKCGDKQRSFIFPSDKLEIAGFASDKPGRKSVSVSFETNGTTKTRSFGVYVVPAYNFAEAKYVTIGVDGSYNGFIGKTAADGVTYMFNTVQQAMDFIACTHIPNAAEKDVNLAPGKYFEKVEIFAPNVHLSGKDKETTIIEYDALFGERDESGFVHTTDSTATLNVRHTAVGFVMTGITVNNSFCTQAYFNEVFSNGQTYDQRALAGLIMSDKTIIDDCVFNGLQDTLELFTGRQVITNTLITGRTDFLFGTNSTTYFYNCEIRSINTGKSGGYITAFKGQSSGASDKIKYGIIFDDCDFTFENGVGAASISIGRTWGPSAAVMIMNSHIGAHVSKTGSTRYLSMNGKPEDAQFFEYNNEGDGALATAIKEMTIPTEAVAAEYGNVEIIFAKVNGNLTDYYDDAWIPQLAK